MTSHEQLREVAGNKPTLTSELGEISHPRVVPGTTSPLWMQSLFLVFVPVTHPGSSDAVQDDQIDHSLQLAHTIPAVVSNVVGDGVEESVVVVGPVLVVAIVVTEITTVLCDVVVDDMAALVDVAVVDAAVVNVAAVVVALVVVIASVVVVLLGMIVSDMVAVIVVLHPDVRQARASRM